MMKKFIALTTAAIAAAALSASAEVSVTVASAYIFRGATINDDVNVQPGFSTTAFGDKVNVGTWANFNTDSSDFDEIDYFFGIPLPLGEDSPVGIEVGYTEYAYPTAVDDEGNGLEADREPSIKFTGGTDDIGVVLGVYYGVDGLIKDTLYVELGLSTGVDLAENVALGLSATLGYADIDEGESGFGHLTLGASLGVTIPEIEKDVTLGVGYVVETDDAVLEVDEDLLFTVGFSL